MVDESRSLDAQGQAALALHRFGFGPRPGDIADVASDPRGAVLAELHSGTGPVDDSQLLSSGQAARAAFEFRKERNEERKEQAANKAAATAQENSVGPGMAPEAVNDPAMQPARPNNLRPGQNQNPSPGVPQQIFLKEAAAHYEAALKTQIGLVERLVWFWSNHFCVSADKVRPVCGAYEREAIRPHVLGKFSDMLLAVESHPAMLFYLDNAGSIGPNSFAGIRRGKGLNENLAREILELHTLGVRTVYNQNDVTNFAKVITGWTIVPLRQDPEHGGEFMFNPRMHEPGTQNIIGKAYPDNGVAQGRGVLADLARHPSTAAHVAGKLARHFVADDPPPALIERLSKSFLDTDGNLMEVSRTLVTSPEAWQAPRNKLKKPGEWTLGAMRMTGLAMSDVGRVLQMQNLLGEPLWRPPAPKGFSDDSAAWLDGLAQRLDIANRIGRIAGNTGSEAGDLVDAALGPLASPETRQTIKRAESRPQALALLLMAPEFQRR
jgi:uncharacterized protein (DUF1800 family)